MRAKKTAPRNSEKGCLSWIATRLWARRALLSTVASLSLLLPLSAAAQLNEECQDCHADQDLAREASGGASESLFIDQALFDQSIHADFSCVDCHDSIDELPHEGPLPPVSCSGCHGAEDELGASVHAGEEGPSCSSCHGAPHTILPSDDPNATLYPLNVYRTCGACHFEKEPPESGEAALLSFDRYVDDIHGRGIIKAGLVVSATCVVCHGGHEILPSQDPGSRVAHQRVSDTCGSCHVGNAADFHQGVHGQALAAGDEEAPTCTTCHRPHEISLVEEAESVEINGRCEACHDTRAKSYNRTYHGKVATLGYGAGGVATCDTCHRAHLILPATDPRSSVSAANRVLTCEGCHEGANGNFASYLVHVDMENLEEYPLLHWVSMAMTALILGVFTFWGLHSLLWLRRSRRERPALSEQRSAASDDAGLSHFRRLTYVQRAMHAVVITSFLGLALTGLPLKFAHAPWASWLMALLGGFRMASAIHRLCATLTFGYFLIHLLQISYRIIRQGAGRSVLWGPESMVPQPADLQNFAAVFRWFFGKGQKPRFDRWAYWEKFDYWAVFWGVAIIGGSGLIMAFPVFFTRFLPGLAVNLALIVHSEEALLAVGFIFAMHFFNTHLKPEKYPIDTTFYTGATELSEYEREHPLEIERLRAQGRLADHLLPAPTANVLRRARRLGFTAVAVGITLLLFILAGVFLD